MPRHTGMLSKRRSVALSLFLLGAGGSASAACKLSRIAELPVTMVDMKPLVTAKINGVEARFAADSGAFFSSISPASAAEFKLKTAPAPFGLRVIGMGGEAQVSVATVKEFTLAGVPIRNVEFLVGGGETGGESVGLLGQNVFRIGDVEYDLAKGTIRLVREDDCAKTNLAYWTNGTSLPFSVLDIDWTTPMEPHTTGTAFINGVRIRVIFDTGASYSFVSLRAAERAGIKVDTPGTRFIGFSRGIGREEIKTWIAPVASFKIGDEEIHNTRLRIADSMVIADMLIGADFFLSHRIYVSTKRRKLFFTYNGGPVFKLANANVAQAGTPGAAASSGATATADSAAAATGGATAASAAAAPGGAAATIGVAAEGPTSPAPGEPKDGSEFSRRGAAFAARKDFVHAIADLTRACELAPGEPDYFYERGIAYRDSGDWRLASADFDEAIKLKPDHVPALVARAELRESHGDIPQAVVDLNAADAAASREADARYRMAVAYGRANVPTAAIAQLDLWIQAHAADARMVDAWRERCWMRAVSGQDLPKALDDCDAALHRADRKDAGTARIFSSRGLVRLRLGEYDKSITDYDAALKLNPKDSWALYGRGIDELRRGKNVESQSDLAAARTLWPPIAEAFRVRGLLP